MGDALVMIAKEEGSVALYRGMAATMMGAAPYTGLKFGFYESLKRGSAPPPAAASPPQHTLNLYRYQTFSYHLFMSTFRS